MAFEDITKLLKATDEQIAHAKELAKNGDFNQAERILKNNLNNVVELYGSNSLKTCNFLVDIAEVNYSQEKYPEVVTTLQQVLSTNNQDPIFSQKDILSIKFKFAKALENSGNYRDASGAYTELLYESENEFGPDARFTKSVGECLNRLNQRHKRNTRIKEAKPEDRVSQFDTTKKIIVQGKFAQSETGKNNPVSEKISQYETAKNKSVRSPYDTSKNPVFSDKANQFETGQYNEVEELSETTNNDAVSADDPQFVTAQNESVEQSGAYPNIDPPRRNKQSNLQRFQSVAPERSRPIGRILTMVAACLLCVGLLLSGILSGEDTSILSENKSPNPSSVKAAPENEEFSTGLAPGTYMTTDGLKVLHVDQDGSGKFINVRDEAQVKVERHGAEVYAVTDDENIVFRTVKNGIKDKEGSTLFKTGVPELQTVASIRVLAANLNSYYRQNGRYPNSQAQLMSMHDRAMFKNPMNDTMTFPRLMSVIERRTSSRMSLSDYSYVNNFTSRLMAQSEAMGAPCGVEIYICPISDQGETVVIRAFDSNGKLLPSSQTGRCYTVVLNNGINRS